MCDAASPATQASARISICMDSGKYPYKYWLPVNKASLINGCLDQARRAFPNATNVVVCIDGLICGGFVANPTKG